MIITTISSKLLQAHHGHSCLVQLLIGHDADFSLANRGDGDQPLHLAATFGHEAVVAILLAVGAPPSPENGYGATPLRQASMGGHWPVVRCLRAVECAREIARSGDEGALRRAVVSGQLLFRRPPGSSSPAADGALTSVLLPSLVQWWGELPGAAKVALRSWAQDAVEAQRACFAALFLPVAPAPQAPQPPAEALSSPAHFESGGADGKASSTTASASAIAGFREAVHDGHAHILRQVVGYLVYPSASTRHHLRFIAAQQRDREDESSAQGSKKALEQQP